MKHLTADPSNKRAHNDSWYRWLEWEHTFVTCRFRTKSVIYEWGDLSKRHTEKSPGKVNKHRSAHSSKYDSSFSRLLRWLNQITKMESASVGFMKSRGTSYVILRRNCALLRHIKHEDYSCYIEHELRLDGSRTHWPPRRAMASGLFPSGIILYSETCIKRTPYWADTLY